MNTQPFRPLYDQAVARGDMDEVARLRDSCPRVKVVASDPDYTELLDRMWHAGIEVLYHWLDVSHLVVRTRLTARVLNRLVLAEALMRGVPGYTKQLKTVVRADRALLVSAEAQCKQRSAAWKGIEAAVTRFCAERGFTIKQLFAMAKDLPRAIEEAREDLDADVPADPKEKEAVYQALCQAVPGQTVRGRG